MPETVSAFDSALRHVVAGAAALSASVAEMNELSAPALLEAQRALAEARRAVDACSAFVAGEIGSRSRRQLGFAGLAQSEGFRSAADLVQHVTGSSARQANAMVDVGSVMHAALSADRSAPSDSDDSSWLPLGIAVSSGSMSVEAASAIRRGLGGAAAEGYPPGLAEALETLVQEARTSDVDALLRRARELRDELDAAGVADRERAIHLERSIRRSRRPGGASRYIIDTDLESAAFWDDLYDSLTSPRRGGVRFVDENERRWAKTVESDPRTVEQYVHDAITDLLRIAAEDPSGARRRILGGRQPAVRVLVTERAINARSGRGFIEGHDVPVSIETVERIACTSGTIAVGFDTHGHVLNLGREQRLYSRHQKVALAARDGGCRFPECSRPPSWTEAHHLEHWQRDRGNTDIADGILLCRFHHLLVHNNHWEIERRGAQYWLIPPPDVDATRTPRLMPSRSRALAELRREASTGAAETPELVAASAPVAMAAVAVAESALAAVSTVEAAPVAQPSLSAAATVEAVPVAQPALSAAAVREPAMAAPA